MARPKGSKSSANGGNGKSRGRKSKAESATGKKEAAAEMRKASDTDELALPKPDDILFHMKAIKGWKERITTLQGSMRNALKAAKKVNKFLPEVINELLALERLDDPTEFKRRMESLGIGLKAIGAPYQLTLHDTLLGDQNELAAKRGYQNGKAGTAINNPYPENSTLSDIYVENYVKGQAELLGASVPETAAEDSDGPFPADHNERNSEESFADA